jgi:hypothetical protein
MNLTVFKCYSKIIRNHNKTQDKILTQIYYQLTLVNQHLMDSIINYQINNQYRTQTLKNLQINLN